ncbi:MAG: DUF2304 domain-containing protein [Oscillospiraceae bacterium]|nr:DUF2304 domain-containing protein [Oscillospiraceae bacterium]
MDLELRIFLGIGVILYFALLLHMLKKESIILKYALIWLVCGGLFVLVLIFPEVVFSASRLLGVSNPVNAVFLLFAGFALMMLLSFSSIISKNNGMVRKLTQQLALLENRVRELENKEK